MTTPKRPPVSALQQPNDLGDDYRQTGRSIVRQNGGAAAANGGPDVKIAIAASSGNLIVASAGLFVLDGVVLNAGDYVLLYGQTAPPENGYYLTSIGAWRKISQPGAVAVQKGALDGRKVFVLNSANTYLEVPGVYG